jgi:hypothetical protein
MATFWYRLWCCVVERNFVFGGQQYGDILVPSVGLRCGKKFCVWWAAVWRHFGTVCRAALWKEILSLVGSSMATFWCRLQGCTISMHCNVGLL